MQGNNKSGREKYLGVELSLAEVAGPPSPVPDK